MSGCGHFLNSVMQYAGTISGLTLETNKTFGEQAGGSPDRVQVFVPNGTGPNGTAASVPPAPPGWPASGYWSATPVTVYTQDPLIAPQIAGAAYTRYSRTVASGAAEFEAINTTIKGWSQAPAAPVSAFTVLTSRQKLSYQPWKRQGRQDRDC